MKYHILILGCQYNYYDAKYVAHLLEKMGYVYCDKDINADVIIILACSVRQKAVDRIFGKVRKWKKLPQKPKVIISACVLPEDKKKLIDKVDGILDIKNIETTLSKLLNKNITTKQCNNDLVFTQSYEPEKTAYVPIMQGCNNWCTYCAVPITRGKEVSRSEKEILDEIKQQIANGYKNIVLLGQNVNSYGEKVKSQKSKVKTTSQNLKSNIIPFAQLLEKVDKLDGDFTYNFTSSNPHDFQQSLIDVLAKLKKWPHILHLPMQSGDDKILKKMNRKYTSKQFSDLIDNLKLKIKNLCLSTDIIVGFPSETKTQFNDTVELCKKIGFHKAYVAQYSPRPNTFSARFMNDNVSRDEKKRRWKILDNLINKKKKCR